MSEMDDDIEQARQIVQEAWEDYDWAAWLAGSCVLLGWRLARWLGWAR